MHNNTTSPMVSFTEDGVPVLHHLLQSDALHEYILKTSVYPREHEQLRALREATLKHKWGVMCLDPEEGQLLSMLLKLMNAKRTIEIGVFTGYSALATALALPDDGKIIAIDVDGPSFEAGLRYIRKAGVEHKIDFIKSEAMPVLDKMLQEVNDGEGLFDFAFVDADKNNYTEYHERLLKLVKVGGVIAYDNTLWSGTVAADEDVAIRPRFDALRKAIVKLNALLAADPRIELVQICVGDGITICRRIS